MTLDLGSAIKDLNEQFAQLELEKKKLAENQKKSDALLAAQARLQTKSATTDGRVEGYLLRAYRMIHEFGMQEDLKGRDISESYLKHMMENHPEAIVNLATLIQRVEP